MNKLRPILSQWHEALWSFVLVNTIHKKPSKAVLDIGLFCYWYTWLFILLINYFTYLFFRRHPNNNNNNNNNSNGLMECSLSIYL